MRIQEFIMSAFGHTYGMIILTYQQVKTTIYYPLVQEKIVSLFYMCGVKQQM